MSTPSLIVKDSPEASAELAEEVEAAELAEEAAVVDEELDPQPAKSDADKAPIINALIIFFIPFFSL